MSALPPKAVMRPTFQEMVILIYSGCGVRKAKAMIFFGKRELGDSYSPIITKPLVNMIVDQSVLSKDGHHSLDHWVRVLVNGRKLSKFTGANLKVVELFSVFHDARRFNEGYDPEHGLRGAQFATEMRGEWFDATKHEMELLVYACKNHSDGLTEADVTVQTCWDADRLDLGRVGTTPNAEYLCTGAAKDSDMIDWAHRRAVK